MPMKRIMPLKRIIMKMAIMPAVTLGKRSLMAIK